MSVEFKHATAICLTCGGEFEFPYVNFAIPPKQCNECREVWGDL